jgi:hypothetical protein
MRSSDSSAAAEVLRKMFVWTRACITHPFAAMCRLIVPMSMLFVGLTASAQYTPVGLYQYPNTDNNTSGITANSLLAQGPDGEFYDTDWSNGEYNSGSVYTISLSGAMNCSTASVPREGPASLPEFRAKNTHDSSPQNGRL